MLTLDQVFNAASKIHYMFGGKLKCPMVIRATVGQGWGQGPNHSQAFHSIYSHFPGMKVVLPSNPYDAKGLMVSSIFDNNPVLFLEHKSLYNSIGFVPKKFYKTKIGKANLIETGNDLSLIGFSSMLPLMKKVSQTLKTNKINCDIIDLRSSYPIDKMAIIKSVKKTGKLVIFDIDWSFCGASAEVSALVSEKIGGNLKSNIVRITPPHISHPVSYALEKYFYPDEKDVLKKIYKII